MSKTNRKKEMDQIKVFESFVKHLIKDENCTSLDGRDWANLLIAFPGARGKCPWKKLDHTDWTRLLMHRPDEFKRRSEWKIVKQDLSKENWARLLGTSPEFAKDCPCVDQFSSVEWVSLINAYRKIEKSRRLLLELFIKAAPKMTSFPSERLCEIMSIALGDKSF